MRHQKGGSVASDAVTGLVSESTFKQMNVAFSNEISGKQCGGRLASPKCAVCGGRLSKQHCAKGSRCGGCKKGGAGVNSLVPSAFQSSPAPALNAGLLRASLPQQPVAAESLPKGGAKKSSTACKSKSQCTRSQKGGEIASLASIMKREQNDSYALYNKRGGATNVSVGLGYSSIPQQGLPEGIAIDRTVGSQSVPNRILATEQVPSMPLVQKVAQYAYVTDTKLPFSYASNKATVAPTSGGGLWSASKKGAKKVKEVGKKVVSKVASKLPKKKPVQAKKA